MITNYRPNKRRFPRLTKVLTPIVVVGLLYLASLTGLLQSLERLALALARPLWSISANEEATLEQQVATLERQLLAAGLEHSELESLRAIFNREQSLKPKTVGSILARPPTSPYDTLVIDVGQSAHVILGDLVVVDGSIILGEIVEVYPRTAKARLYSWPEHKLAVTVAGQSAGVEAVGRGGGNFKLDLPRELEIGTSTLVTVPALGRELVLAVVGDVERTASDPFQYVYARSPVNLYQLKQVEIYDATTIGS